MMRGRRPIGADTSEEFDPYHIWLGIRPEEHPCSLYRLLGLVDFENDLDAIEEATERQIAHVRRKAIGKYQDASQRLLNELAAASALLFDPVEKARYDEQLRAFLAPDFSLPSSQPTFEPSADSDLDDDRLIHDAIPSAPLVAPPECVPDDLPTADVEDDAAVQTLSAARRRQLRLRSRSAFTVRGLLPRNPSVVALVEFATSGILAFVVGAFATARHSPSSRVRSSGRRMATNLARSATPYLSSLIVLAICLTISSQMVIPRPSNRNKITLVYRGPEEAEEIMEFNDTLTPHPLDVDMAVANTSHALHALIEAEVSWRDELVAASHGIEKAFQNGLKTPEFKRFGPSTSDIAVLDIPDAAEHGRRVATRAALTSHFGGDATTESAVRKGLEWLKRQQKAEGNWSLTGPFTDGIEDENRIAATAMALLAFQGHLHSHQDGAYQQEVAKAWAFLLNAQDRSGQFHDSQGVLRAVKGYSQPMATLALCENWRQTHDSNFKRSAQLSVDFAARSQSSEGGWRYEPRSDHDTSITAWYVAAMYCARGAGLDVPAGVLTRASTYLDRVAIDDGSEYAYKPGLTPTTATNAAGLFCRQLLGWKIDDPRLTRGARNVLASPIDYGKQDVYAWYFSTAAMRNMEGEYWRAWNAKMRLTIPAWQVSDETERGSWSPGKDRWGRQGGRLFTTCFSILMLESYYRVSSVYWESPEPRNPTQGVRDFAL